MSTLAQQQRLLHDAVVQQAPADGLLQAVQGRAPMLGIYRHAYAARLAAALRDNFGVLPRAMGDEAFERLAQAYLASHPSRHPSIRWFGDRLVEFMSGRADLVPHPALVDLARMEWALRSAFDAADAPPLEAEVLAALPPSAWPGLVLRFHTSLQRLALQWHVEPAWRALQQDGEPELPEPTAGEHLLLVWRPVRQTRWRSVADPVEAALLQAAVAGKPFGTLCELAAAQVGEAQAAAAAAQALRQWVCEGLLADASGFQGNMF